MVREADLNFLIFHTFYLTFKFPTSVKVLRFKDILNVVVGEIREKKAVSGVKGLTTLFIQDLHSPIINPGWVLQRKEFNDDVVRL